MINIRQSIPSPRTFTWDQYKAAIRRVDRDSLLAACAGISAEIDADRLPKEFARLGLSAWGVMDLSRMALAWSTFQRPAAVGEDIARLCNMGQNLQDDLLVNEKSPLATANFLARMFFDQFPSQSSVLAEVARTIQIFGSASEFPSHHQPEVMKEGWLQSLHGGLTVDQYIGAVFFLYVSTLENRGVFDPKWLDTAGMDEIDFYLSREAISDTFTNYMATTSADFKVANAIFQSEVPANRKRFAFNYLRERPFILDAGPVPIAPSAQAVIGKASPSAIFYRGMTAHGTAFSRDLGHVFEHYVGRQLSLLSEPAAVMSEVRYGRVKSPLLSVDWFLDLPDVIVLIECKAVRPVENVRLGSENMAELVNETVGKVMKQINRSNAEFRAIATAEPALDASKRRFGMVVTLENFYLAHNPFLRSQVARADIPTAVVACLELEWIVMQDPHKLSQRLVEAATTSESGVLDLNGIVKPEEVENTLLTSTWEGIELFSRLRGSQVETHESVE